MILWASNLFLFWFCLSCSHFSVMNALWLHLQAIGSDDLDFQQLHDPSHHFVLVSRYPQCMNQECPSHLQNLFDLNNIMPNLQKFNWLLYQKYPTYNSWTNLNIFIRAKGFQSISSEDIHNFIENCKLYGNTSVFPIFFW